MPIEFVADPDGAYVRQSFVSPTVYLDHWAIRLLSDDHGLQDRFVNALRSKDGTLLLSNISLSEFAATGDTRHCLDAEAFLERLLPNIYFTDFALDQLLSLEEAEPNNIRRYWPPADLPQLKFFAERAQHATFGFTMHGFISLTHTYRAELVEATAKMVQVIRSGMESTRNDAKYIAKIRHLLPGDARPRTLVIFGELVRGFKLDRNASISDNDILDLLHATMPVNCCDFVLLDGPWVERVEKMKQRFAKAGAAMSIASCFSNRGNGIAEFLKALEAFSTSA